MDNVPQGMSDPNSVIAELLRQMQGSADQTRVPPEMEAQFRNQLTPPGGAQPGPVGTGPGMNEIMGGGMEIPMPHEMQGGPVGMEIPMPHEMGRNPQDFIQMLLGQMGR